MRIGVDVGGTTVKIGFVENKKVVHSYQVETEKETLFDDVCKSIKSTLEKMNITDVEGIGFGIPGTVKDNYIYYMPNVGLSNIDIKKVVGAYFPNVKIASGNDANVAALGEVVNDPSVKTAYMITLGTGVGGGYIYDGKVIEGAHACCGEVGHMFLDYVHNFTCNCGLKGCFETVASATGVVRLAKHYYDNYVTKLDKNLMTCKDVFDAARDGDALGEATLDMVSRYLARGLSVIAASTDVEAFYIGGGVSYAGDILFDRVRKYYADYAYNNLKNIEIKPAKLKNDAGMLGAAYLF